MQLGGDEGRCRDTSIASGAWNGTRLPHPVRMAVPTQGNILRCQQGPATGSLASCLAFR